MKLNPGRLPDSIPYLLEVVIAIRPINIDSVIEIIIEKLISDGRGMGRCDGRVIFAAGVIPGETVRLRITRIRSGFAEGELVALLESSPERVVPPCPHFFECGGCSLQYIAPAAQLEFKQAALRDSLRRLGKLQDADIPQLQVVSGHDRGYRNRMRFAASETGAWGLRGKRSNAVVPIRECLIAHPRISEAVSRTGTPPGVRPGEEFCVYADDHGMYCHQDAAEARVSGISFTFPVRAFFQSNRHLLEKALPHIIGNIPEGRVADLYGGIGVFSVFLQRSGHHCVSVDSGVPSASDAAVPAGISFRRMTVEQWISTPEADGDFAAVILDPPRAGLSPEVRRYLGRARIGEIRYLSCNPDTFARDAGEIVRSGRKCTGLWALDFYPHTSHLEVLGVFS